LEKCLSIGAIIRRQKICLRHMNGLDMVDKSEPRTRKRRWIVPLLVVLVVAGTSASLFLLYGRRPEILARFIGYGYLGAFLVSLIGNASVFLFWGMVLPILVVIGTMLYPVSGLLGPVGVGLVGGAGAGIGEITGYLIGYSGRGIMEKSQRYSRLVNRIGRKGPLAVFVFSLVPFAFDVVAIAAGALRIPLWQFVIACWLGRTILYVSVITLVALGWDAVLPLFP
jgi:membrane protein YqaA with SNARE-associated domain